MRILQQIPTHRPSPKPPQIDTKLFKLVSAFLIANRLWQTKFMMNHLLLISYGQLCFENEYNYGKSSDDSINDRYSILR